MKYWDFDRTGKFKSIERTSTVCSLPVHETKGAVIQGKTQDAHVVCVKDTMAKPNTLPLGH